jgi:uncharacterized protein YjcR
LPRFIRQPDREYIYQREIASLVLKRVRACDVAERYNLPASTVRSWVSNYKRRFSSEVHATIAAEARLLRG